MTDVGIRPARADDAQGIAVVHVRAWQQAYHGLMPQSVLDDLSIAQRTTGWQEILADAASTASTIVAEREGEVAGWASFGAARDAEAPGTGELWGIYAHPEAWSTGVGHALITAVEDVLRTDGHETAYLWVLEGNERAATFYERHGWASDGARKVERRPGLELHELRHVKRLG